MLQANYNYKMPCPEGCDDYLINAFINALRMPR